MTILRKPNQEQGFLNGQFLLAMPGMNDERFARAVIYICAHSEEGAMGFIINQLQPLGFPDLLRQLGIIEGEDLVMLPKRAQQIMVRNGGPVDRTRGFVLHSDDYMADSTMPVTENICLTATVDILHAIYSGNGPSQALLTLGYSGWAPGQLDMEFAENGWLACPAPMDMLFDSDITGKYERLMVRMGIDMTRLVSEAGHA
ncbi:YqgE/AlgH family protein [Ochrobactrum sp. Marseille-Q0166]|uniref:YqgE/AlgH family protein n=1 Tax=Ochrobactrum sp. Marseille-Q0166 TaxID=2761105 RepID=UPI0016556DAD|nr:YqgE/AlgH family protein [Ochrobactrum sp. Marseille-Q0166]MBC8717908.1 YqgE/AlgH family protein [Ochrobactrum sp. Marseille-Q0166]